MDKVPESAAPTPNITPPSCPPSEATCAVPPLLIRALVEELGTPDDQLPGLNQLPVPPVHVVVCAKAFAGKSENISHKATKNKRFIGGFWGKESGDVIIKRSSGQTTIMGVSSVY